MIAASRRVMTIPLVMLCGLLLALLRGGLAQAQVNAEVQPLGPDAASGLDRYQITLGPGATLWAIASTLLPLTRFDAGDAEAYRLVVESFQRAFPDRPPESVRPDDRFVLEVPAGTFVTEHVSQEGETLVYRSFQGDQLTYYPRHPILLYRLVRADQPRRAVLSLTGQGGTPVDLARELFHVDQPDFIQVRAVRAALSDRRARVTVDLDHPYLDDFRNYRDRAISVEDSPDGKKIYLFAPDDPATPFVRVEDAVGDQHDPAAFPREWRLAFYRDGTVRRYLVTEPGDTLSALSQPDAASWQRVLPSIKAWEAATVESIPPFSPAINENGGVIPGRLLVLSFAPKVAAVPTDTQSSPSSSAAADLRCLGVPLAVVLLLLGWRFGGQG